MSRRSEKSYERGENAKKSKKEKTSRFFSSYIIFPARKYYENRKIYIPCVGKVPVAVIFARLGKTKRRSVKQTGNRSISAYYCYLWLIFTHVSESSENIESDIRAGFSEPITCKGYSFGGLKCVFIPENHIGEWTNTFICNDRIFTP